MVKAFGWNLKDAGSRPAWHYSFPCLDLLLREFIIYSEFIYFCSEQQLSKCSENTIRVISEKKARC